MKQKVIYIFVFFVIGYQIQAQDIKGAYIRTSWVQNTISLTPIYEYSYTLTLLTDPTMNVPRPIVTLHFGDNSSGTLSITSSNTINDITIKTYSGTHLYSGGSGASPSHYKIQFLDSFRIAGISNISFSQTQPIYAESRIYANNNFWTKSSGTITNFPPVLGVSGNNVIYDPMFIKGTITDSVSYALYNCYATSYHLPNEAALDPATGVLTFSKDSLGLYAFNIRISEWGKNTSNVPEINRTTFVDFILDINTTVGINESKIDKSTLRLYPNPVSTSLFVDNTESNNKNFNYCIYSADGQMLSEGSLNSNTKKSINVSNLTQGIYFITISDEAHSFRNKFVKLNN